MSAYVPPAEMDAEEVFAGAIALAAAIAGLYRAYLPLFFVTRLNESRLSRTPLILCPPLCLGVLFAVLRFLSAVEVREDGRYIALFLVIGTAWMAASFEAMPLMGLSVRQDAIEGGNAAAAAAACGGVAGPMAVYAGANIGEGPTIWTTIGPALLGTVALYWLWLLVEAASGIADSVTVERDRAAGVRQGSFLLAAGLVLGRAMAGDWADVDSLFRDLALLGWPAAVLALAAVLLHRSLRPTPRRPEPSVLACGFLPGAALLTPALFWSACR